MTTYKKEVLTVLDDNMNVLGYLAQGELLYGVAMDIDNSWYFTKDLLLPDWKGAFSNSKEAKIYLENKKERR